MFQEQEVLDNSNIECEFKRAIDSLKICYS